jgi:3-dehydroquinate dehydratase type I
MAGFGFWRTRESLPGLTREILACAEKNPSGIYIGGAVHRPPRLTAGRAGVSAAAVSHSQVILEPSRPRVVGSFGSAECLASTPLEAAAAACDWIEVRLDLLDDPDARPWAHLSALPLLFTARRGDEGGRGDLSASERAQRLRAVLAEAALIDIELVSAAEMSGVLAEMKAAGVPWIASWHDFEGRPDSFGKIPAMAEEAAAKGAACFKAAVRLHGAGDLEKLVRPLAHPAPLPLSLMGMGPLAPVSRLLCAQHGSVLNYGYVGDAPTAPGQWSAAQLKAGVAALEMLH